MKNTWLSKANAKKHNGFPQDDENSITCGCGETVDLSYWYDHQFISEEVTYGRNLWGNFEYCSNTTHFLKYKPIAGTMTGCVYLGDRFITTFVIDVNGQTHFSDQFDRSEIEELKHRPEYGLIEVDWSERIAFSGAKLVISYETNTDDFLKAQGIKTP